MTEQCIAMKPEGPLRNPLRSFRRLTVDVSIWASQCLAFTAAMSALTWSVSIHGTDTATTKRPFTVKDSIEISQIVDPARSTTIELHERQPTGTPICSPDGRYFLLVTQRGVLSANKLEGTIWLFDQKIVRDHILANSPAKLVPKKLVTVRSTSNTPVIEDVRWIDGSKKVAFLAKNDSPYQRLFVVDVQTTTMVALTKEELYVTAFEMRGDVLVYTTLAEDNVEQHSTRKILNVGGRSALGLLYRNPPAIQDVEESYLLKHPNYLHVEQGGRDIPVRFPGTQEPLQVFVPSISLSPDKKLLVTVAPVADVPKAWERYQPRFEQFRLKDGRFLHKDLTTLESFWRPEEYIVVDLATGLVFPLLDAPAGRDLGYGSVPTQAFWLADSRHVVLTNAYVPLSDLTNSRGAGPTVNDPTFVLMDVVTRQVQNSINLRQSSTAAHYEAIDGVQWDPARNEITIHYRSTGDSRPLSGVYSLKLNEWRHSGPHKLNNSVRLDGINAELEVHEDLNHPTVLRSGSQSSEAELILWDPNPQLSQVELGMAKLYHWQDMSGRTWSGILALPPEYTAGRRYPLVIQTHGDDPDAFFADGAVTTGNGGRALAAKGIIVLQTGDYFPDMDGPQEGPNQLAMFESAISLLVSQGLVDRTRVGIIGFSRTCFHVMYALTHSPGLFRAAAVTDGVNFSYVEYVLAGAQDQYQEEAEGINGGSPFGGNLLAWLQDAPNFSLGRVKAALLISAYLRGSLLSQWETFSGLRRLKKPVEMSWWPRENTPHILVQPVQRYSSQQSAVEWFDFWLNEHKDLDPDKADQYARWETLRKLETNDGR